MNIPQLRFIAATLLLSLTVVSVSQTAKRKPKPKPKLDLSSLDKPFTTPCGIRYKNFDELMEEGEQEWRIASISGREVFYYNTKKQSCEKGIVRVWVKGVSPKDETITRSMTRYELNCRTDKLRRISSIEYSDTGTVNESSNPASPQWRDVVPESIGENILETVCRKSI